MEEKRDIFRYNIISKENTTFICDIFPEDDFFGNHIPISMYDKWVIIKKKLH